VLSEKLKKYLKKEILRVPSPEDQANLEALEKGEVEFTAVWETHSPAHGEEFGVGQAGTRHGAVVRAKADFANKNGHPHNQGGHVPKIRIFAKAGTFAVQIPGSLFPRCCRNH